MEQSWAASTSGSMGLHNTWASLHSVAKSLKKWSKETFGSVRKKIRSFERQLLFLRIGPFDAANIAETRGVENKLCELFEVEEIMAQQRSHVEWLKEGDRNTAFFHARASARRRTNTIKALVREDGTKCDQL